MARARRTYLQMLDSKALRRARQPDALLRFERLHACPASFYRFLYEEVGRRHEWTDRASWTDQDIVSHLRDPAVSLWVLSNGGCPAGYAELQKHDDGSAEVAYVGVLESFRGQGLGGYLVTLTVEAAWALGPSRVWLQASTLDHPAALRTYLARGFQAYCEEEYDPRARMVRHVAAELIAHAREQAPEEACGLLIGRDGWIARSMRARNLRASPNRFEVDPRDHFAAIRQARGDRLAVVGAYHSHPASAPVPSETDLAEATYPDYLYVIVAPEPPHGPVLKAYRLTPARYEAVELEIVGGAAAGDFKTP
jgi:proteasome lid subunit RPN8/RPN11/GNAT superfamily N-acetyltransferase